MMVEPDDLAIAVVLVPSPPQPLNPNEKMAMPVRTY
jgi:hypothetical protein